MTFVFLVSMHPEASKAVEESDRGSFGRSPANLAADVFGERPANFLLL